MTKITKKRDNYVSFLIAYAATAGAGAMYAIL